jgi:hypothetical protein
MAFELPKGLPEGPWTTDEDFTTVLAGDIQICDTWGREQFASAIALIPAMVKEIERAQLLHESDQACIRDCLAHIDRISALNAELVEALRLAIKIAAEAQDEWDKAPSGMRAGKILIALAGGLKGYRPDIDKVHGVLAKAILATAVTSES